MWWESVFPTVRNNINDSGVLNVLNARIYSIYFKYLVAVCVLCLLLTVPWRRFSAIVF